MVYEDGSGLIWHEGGWRGMAVGAAAALQARRATATEWACHE